VPKATLDVGWCYRLLELDPGVSAEEVKHSYRDLMQIWHPDRFSHDSRLRQKCEEKVKRIGDAYRSLIAVLPLYHATAGEPSYSAFTLEQQPDLGATMKAVRIEGKWGFTDASGKLAIPAVFDTEAEFAEGLAAVQLDGQFGYIDPSGHFVVKPQFRSADSFSDGRAMVQPVARFGYIDKSGQFVVRARFESGQRFAEGFAGVQLNGRSGYIAADGEWLVEPQFDEVHAFSHGRAYARLGSRWYQVLSTGEVQKKD